MHVNFEYQSLFSSDTHLVPAPLVPKANRFSPPQDKYKGKSQYPKPLMLMSGVPFPLVLDLAEVVFTYFLIFCPYFLF